MSFQCHELPKCEQRCLSERHNNACVCIWVAKLLPLHKQRQWAYIRFFFVFHPFVGTYDSGSGQFVAGNPLAATFNYCDYEAWASVGSLNNIFFINSRILLSSVVDSVAHLLLSHVLNTISFTNTITFLHIQTNRFFFQFCFKSPLEKRSFAGTSL